MSVFIASHAFAKIPVVELDSAVEWYTRCFGRGPDMTPKEDEVVWHVAPTASVFVAVDAARAGTADVVLAVPDLTGCARELETRGIAVTSEGEGAARKIVAVDRDGNRLAFFANPETERGTRT